MSYTEKKRSSFKLKQEASPSSKLNPLATPPQGDLDGDGQSEFLVGLTSEPQPEKAVYFIVTVNCRIP